MKYVSLFTGLGGLDLGFELAGHEMLYASDIDPHAVRALQDNAGVFGGAKIECADVRALTANYIRDAVAVPKGAVDCLVGGPPCQSWSSAGKQRGYDDPRGQLVHDYVRIAKELDVRWIVFENVRGLLTARGPSGLPGEALELLRQTLLDAGFQTSVQLLNSADFGVPQRRVRLFIIGYRSGDEPQFPPPTHSKQGDSALLQWVSMEEAIRGLGPKSEDDVIRPSAKLHAQLSTLKPGTGVKSPGKPEATRPGGHWGYKQGAFLADTRLPARTITASSQQDWIDDPEWGIRKLSPRECARLQSFPDDWMITGSKAVQYRLIGNAVPPLLAMKLAQSLLPLKSSPRIEQKAFEELTPLPSSLRSAIEYTIRDNMRNGASRRAS